MLALSPCVFGGFSSSANSSLLVKTEQVLYESFGEGLLWDTSSWRSYPWHLYGIDGIWRHRELTNTFVGAVSFKSVANPPTPGDFPVPWRKLWTSLTCCIFLLCGWDVPRCAVLIPLWLWAMLLSGQTISRAAAAQDWQIWHLLFLGDFSQ